MAKTAIHPEQEALLVQDRLTGTEYPVVQNEPVEEHGVSVDLQERAAHLHSALGELGIMSRSIGLEKATHSARFSKGIENRYGKATRTVASRAMEANGERERKAKDAFEKAFGTTALIESGLMAEDEAKAMARRGYKSFKEKYADSHHRHARDGYKRQLTRIGRTLSKVTKREA